MSSTPPLQPLGPEVLPDQGVAGIWVRRAREAVGYVRLRPFDTSTPEGRSRERYRRAVLSFGTSLFARLITVATQLVATRLALGYLAPERYGLWMAISSTALTFLVFADLGLGNGLLNALSAARGQDDEKRASEIVSSSFFMLLAVALALLAITLAIHPFIPWASLLRVSTPLAASEAAPAMLVFVLCFLINIPLGIVSRVQSGYQEGYRTSLWAIGGSLVGLLMTIVAIRARAGLPGLVLAASGAPILATVANGWALFWRERPHLRPRLSRARRKTADAILRLGALFFLLQMTSAVAYQTDNLVVTRFFGAAAVTTYAVPMQLFSAIPIFVLMMLMPLWPAYGEALSRGDVGWVRQTLGRSILLSIAMAAVVAVPLTIFGRPLIHLWVGPGVTPSISLLAGMGTLAVVLSGGNAVAVFLNGVSWVRFQLILGVIVALAALGLKIALAPVMGIEGVVWATVVAWTIPSSIAYGMILPKRLERLATRS